MNVSIILPTKNEEECIGEVIGQIQNLNLGHDYQIVVVDDSTNDKTHAAVLMAKKKYNVNVLFLGGRGNESPSIKWALNRCNTEYSIVVDSDGSQDIGIIPRMLEELSGNDLVVGSRYMDGGDPGSTNAFSSFGNKFATWMLGLLTKDLTGRFFAAKTDLLLRSSEWGGRGENSIDVVNYCEKRGLSICEIPFVYKDRIGGKSKTNIPKYIKTYLKKVLSLKIDGWKLFSEKYISRAFRSDWTGEEKDDLGYWKRFISCGIENFQIFPVLFMMLFFRIPVVGNVFGPVVTSIGRGIPGFFIRSCYYKTRLGFMGKDVFIDSGVLLFGCERMYIDDGSFIDRNASIECVEGRVRIGKCVHIGSGAYINGKPYLDVGNYSCIDCGAVVFGSSNKRVGKNGMHKSMSCVSPIGMQEIEKVGMTFGKFSFIGPNAVVVCSNIGDYGFVVANSFVKEDVGDYCIAVGNPARSINSPF